MTRSSTLYAESSMRITLHTSTCIVNSPSVQGDRGLPVSAELCGFLNVSATSAVEESIAMKTVTNRYVSVIALVSGLAFAGAAFAGGDKGDSANHELQMMDTNHDGKISEAEHAAGAKKMFTMMDANKDGKVTADEMDAAHKKMMGKDASAHDMSSADKIKAVDADGDGVLTAAEHEAASKQ